MEDKNSGNYHGNRIRQAIEIINEFDSSKPLSAYLQFYFKTHKNMGSNDRKQTSTIIYQYFRLGKNLPDMEIEKRIGFATFLCNDENKGLVEYLVTSQTPFEYWKVGYPIERKLELMAQYHPEFSVNKIFPLSNYLSEMSDSRLFMLSHLSQPKVWIRIRKGKKEAVVEELKKVHFEYSVSEINENCFRFDVHYPLHELKSYYEHLFEIQDLGSQMTGDFYTPNQNEIWWDACAGAGGKSLILADMEPTVSLVITDKRNSILNNLKERFEKAEVKDFKAFQCDLSEPNPINYPHESFDGIILDAPCTGSGTWAATPEILSVFDYKSISEYHHLQTQIAQNVLPYLKKGKPLIYITCSVYKQENEDVVKFLCNNFNLTLESQQIIEGYRYGASTFFVARMIK